MPGVTATFTIHGRLPGMNEIIDAAKSHYGQYSKMKKTNTEAVAWMAKRVPPMDKVRLVITWYEPDAKRDIDNVASGVKFILDGLVMAGRLPNDTRKHVKGIEHRFEVDRKNPRIEVELQQA